MPDRRPAPESNHRPAQGARTYEPPIGAARSNQPIAAHVWTPEPVLGEGDPEVARVAGAQQGYIAREQVLAAGLGRHAIAHRLRTGRLIERYRSVYLVGRPSVEPLGEETAAVLSFAGHAVLSHATAAAMWGLLDRQPRIVTVTAVGRHRHSSGILHVHRSNNLSAQDVRARHRLPVTNPARTLLDLATTEHDLERAVAEARVQGLIRPGQIEAAIGRAPKHPGISPITALLSVDSGPAWTRSDGERRLLQLIRDANLPLPLVNQRVLTYEVDFVWPAQKLIVETDGHRFHGHRGAFEADRRRDQALAAAGYRVMRITWRQLVAEPTVVIARIAMALAQTAAA